jgi:hypothetical protein
MRSRPEKAREKKRAKSPGTLRNSALRRWPSPVRRSGQARGTPRRVIEGTRASLRRARKRLPVSGGEDDGGKGAGQGVRCAGDGAARAG